MRGLNLFFAVFLGLGAIILEIDGGPEWLIMGDLFVAALNVGMFVHRTEEEGRD